MVWASACVFSHTKAARWTARDVRKIFSAKPEGRWTRKEAPMCFPPSPVHTSHPPTLWAWFLQSSLPLTVEKAVVWQPVGSTPASTSATARKCTWGALCCVRAGKSLGVPTSTALPSSKALGRGVTLRHSHQLLQHRRWLYINSFCSTKIHLHELASFLTVVNGFHYSFSPFSCTFLPPRRRHWSSCSQLWLPHWDPDCCLWDTSDSPVMMESILTADKIACCCRGNPGSKALLTFQPGTRWVCLTHCKKEKHFIWIQWGRRNKFIT